MRKPLKAWRESVALTQLELAVLANTYPSQISHYERGTARPTYRTVLAIVGALRGRGARIKSVEDVEFAAFSAARKSDNAR